MSETMFDFPGQIVKSLSGRLDPATLQTAMNVLDDADDQLTDLIEKASDFEDYEAEAELGERQRGVRSSITVIGSMLSLAKFQQDVKVEDYPLHIDHRDPTIKAYVKNYLENNSTTNQDAE